MPQKCPKNKRSQTTPPAKIRNRNHYNKGFWRVLFFQFESDYLHSKGHSLTRVSFFRFGSRINPPTLPHPQTPSLGEGAGGRSRLFASGSIASLKSPHIWFMICCIFIKLIVSLRKRRICIKSPTYKACERPGG